MSQTLTRFGFLVGAMAVFASPAALAGEQHLDFKLVVIPVDAKTVEAPNLPGQKVNAARAFGVAYFTDGRVAAKDFIEISDLLNGTGSIKGYSTYTFQDGSSITASFIAERKAGAIHGDYTILAGTGMYDKATGTGSFDSVPTKWTDGAGLFNGKFDVKTP